MSDLSGTIVASKLQPTSTEDTYPTHEDFYGLGGYMAVPDIATRDAIPADRRRELMMCGVKAAKTIYVLFGGIENINWIEVWSLSPPTGGIILENGDRLVTEDGTYGIRTEQL